VDFFSVRTVTTRGLRDMYVMVWLCMTSREVSFSDATEDPNSAWVTKQADLFVDRTANREKKPDIIMHDRDTKFTKEFTARLKERGLRTNALEHVNGISRLGQDEVIHLLNRLVQHRP